jgi:hypothetical protein
MAVEDLAVFAAGGYPRDMRTRILAVAITSLALIGCDETTTPTSITTEPPTVDIVFLGPTARRTDLPASAQACLDGVGPTHIHPSWQDFAAIPMQSLPPDRYVISLTNVPVGRRVTFRINDQNYCDQNPTGAVTRNVTVNNMLLTQNATTPGNGDEPGFAFTLSQNGNVSQ